MLCKAHWLEIKKTKAGPYHAGLFCVGATKLTFVKYLTEHGFVAQIGWRTFFPFPQTHLAYRFRDRYTKSSVAIEDGDADLDFCDLPLEVPRHQRLAE